MQQVVEDRAKTELSQVVLWGANIIQGKARPRLGKLLRFSVFDSAVGSPHTSTTARCVCLNRTRVGRHDEMIIHGAALASRTGSPARPGGRRGPPRRRLQT